MFFSIVMIAIARASFGQENTKLPNEGVLKGIVVDSTHDYDLRNATVAVYRNDSVLTNFGLTDVWGMFAIDKLPLEDSLKLTISFVGYMPISKIFLIHAKNKTLDLKKILLSKVDRMLQDVVVKSVSPVRLNGDTLEFNADAFHLDKNAVVEDLLKKLPGIIVWGDGTITVNGRKVSNVLVNGKQFFGATASIATQNIPKNAVDKIQVYKKNSSEENPFDSTAEVNIKLKNGKDLGYFGKFSVGTGTRKTHEENININFFSPHTRIGIVGARNNVNKIASGVSQLMQNSSFKGVGANIDYQTNFMQPGLNKTVSGGLLLQQEFAHSSRVDSINKIVSDGIAASYFIQKSNSDLTYKTKVITALGDGNTQTQDGSSNTIGKTISNNANTNFVLKNQSSQLEFNASIITKDIISSNNSFQNSSSNIQGPQSTNSSVDDNFDKSKEYKINNVFTTKLGPKNSVNNHWGPHDLRIEYSVDIQDATLKRNLISTFRSFVDSLDNQYVNRQYYTKSYQTSHNIKASLGNLSNSIFGQSSILSTLKVSLDNDLTYSLYNSNQLVKEINADSSYVLNPYLTNRNTYSVVDEKPNVSFSKSFDRDFTNRYSKNLIITLDVKQQIYHDQNNSKLHQFQNYSRSYYKFIPSLNVQLDNNQYGKSEDLLGITLASKAAFPNLNQLYPLVDSSNFYFLQYGNPALKSSNIKQLVLNFRHSGSRIINYLAVITAEYTNNFLGDSMIIRDDGSSAHFTVNTNGYKHFNFNGDIEKDIRLAKVHQLQIVDKPNLDYYIYPNYLQTAATQKLLRIVTNTFTTQNLFSLYYTFKDLLVINASHELSYYGTVQNSTTGTNKFNNLSQKYILSSSIQFNTKLDVRSDITYNRYSINGITTTPFTIWNIECGYRFLKGNNLELKLAALDLLHQNKSIQQNGSAYSLTQTTSNVLENYYMVTLSFFPRKFGKKKE